MSFLKIFPLFAFSVGKLSISYASKYKEYFTVLDAAFFRAAS